MVELIGLSKNFANNIILNNINYRFEEGTINGIIGFNGAGKTTMFNCIAGLLPYEGSININPSTNNVGFLSTQLYLYPKTTGIELIKFCLTAQELDVDMNKINSFNELFELPLEREYTRNYSEGMKKKLNILILLLQKNEVLILDEPFNNLDISTNYILQELLKKIKTKKTILISSHILDPLINLCDTISVLHDANIQATYNVNDFDKVEQFFREKSKININNITDF